MRRASAMEEAHPDHAFEGYVCARALVEAVACEWLLRFHIACSGRDGDDSGSAIPAEYCWIEPINACRISVWTPATSNVRHSTSSLAFSAVFSPGKSHRS